MACYQTLTYNFDEVANFMRSVSYFMRLVSYIDEVNHIFTKQTEAAKTMTIDDYDGQWSKNV